MKALQEMQSGANVGNVSVEDGFADQAVETLFPRRAAAHLHGAELTAADIHSRASETGSLLEAILRSRGGPPRRDWGLNE
jgi:hypothetical protein